MDASPRARASERARERERERERESERASERERERERYFIRKQYLSFHTASISSFNVCARALVPACWLAACTRARTRSLQDVVFLNQQQGCGLIRNQTNTSNPSPIYVPPNPWNCSGDYARRKSSTHWRYFTRKQCPLQSSLSLSLSLSLSPTLAAPNAGQSCQVKFIYVPPNHG